jgi:ribonuclease HI
MSQPASDYSSPFDVHLFTDGACSGNPGPGGWAFILRHIATGHEMERSGAEPETTNNRMELTAVVEGLKALKRPCRVQLFTDSVYVGKGLTEWMAGWKARRWMRRERNKLLPVKNVELWQELDRLIQQHRVTYTAVLGHSGHPENERCDQLAVAAYAKYR